MNAVLDELDKEIRGHLAPNIGGTGRRLWLFATTRQRR
jgi:hypothetical protein